MRKRAVLALLMAVTLIMTAGCSLIVKDEEVDRSTVIVEVAGKTITKGEVAKLTESILDDQEYTNSYYSYYYGYDMGFDRNDPETVAAAQDEAVESLIRETVLYAKAEELGFASTEEDIAAAQTAAEEEWQSYMDSVQEAYFADTELQGDEMTAAVQAETEALLGMNKDDTIATLQKQNLDEALNEKLFAWATADVTVTDDEVTARYAEDLQAAKDSYASDPDAYSTDLQSGNTIYTVPAGYRYIKHILIQFSEEDQDAIALADDALYEKEVELNNAAEGTDTSTLEAEVAELGAALDQAKETAFNNLQPIVDEVLAKIEAGEDFEALIDQYGQDPGMQNEPTKTTGYALCADSTMYVSEFQEAAMALANVGDVSAPVRSEADNGIHILKYMADSVEGDVEMTADAAETIRADLLAEKQDAVYDETIARLIEEGNAVIHLDRMK